MTNTTKTLERLKSEAVKSIFGNEDNGLKGISDREATSLIVNLDEILESFAREIQISTLDACRDALPDYGRNEGIDSENWSGWNDYRDEALASIEVLKNL